MKRTYIKPSLKEENAQPVSLLCESFKSNVDLSQGSGSDGEARAPEWDVWGDDME